MLKHTASSIGAILTKIFSLSIRIGKESTTWNTSVVVPIPKSKYGAYPSNYRPISLLSVCSKILNTILESNRLKPSYWDGIIECWRYAVQIILFWNSLMLLLLLPFKSFYYSWFMLMNFIIEKTPHSHYVQRHVHTNCDTGLHLSLLFTLAAITDGQIVIVLIAVLLASPSWFCHIWFASRWQFVHVPCYYSCIEVQMLLACNYSSIIDSSLSAMQTCQVTLISRVRPTFWPVNQHSLAENLN